MSTSETLRALRPRVRASMSHVGTLSSVRLVARRQLCRHPRERIRAKGALSMASGSAGSQHAAAAAKADDDGAAGCPAKGGNNSGEMNHLTPTFAAFSLVSPRLEPRRRLGDETTGTCDTRSGNNSGEMNHLTPTFAARKAQKGYRRSSTGKLRLPMAPSSPFPARSPLK